MWDTIMAGGRTKSPYQKCEDRAEHWWGQGGTGLLVEALTGSIMLSWPCCHHLVPVNGRGDAVGAPALKPYWSSHSSPGKRCPTLFSKCLGSKLLPLFHSSTLCWLSFLLHSCFRHNFTSTEQISTHIGVYWTTKVTIPQHTSSQWFEGSNVL